jgi:glycosyltransferase involved in cell wall biosynthesis
VRIWIDVEDFFDYAARSSRPTGIQRLAFELQRALLISAPEDIHFVRHDRSGTGFITVPFAAVEVLFADLASHGSHDASNKSVGGSPPVHSGARVLATGFLRRLASRLMTRLPLRIAKPLRRFRSHQINAFAALFDVARAIFSLAKPSEWMRKVKAPQQAGGLPFKTTVAADDWLVILDSPWGSNYATLVSSMRARHRLRFALLICDIIPLRHPEWCDGNVIRNFTAFFHSVVPLTDCILAISQSTASDIGRYARENDLTLNDRVHCIPLGTGFGQPPVPYRSQRLPAPQSFALVVSTIEARKNHALLFRVWRELLETTPPDHVPTLVFAGRVGWLVADLMQQLENTHWLGGKILLIESPSDGELATLYQDCLFTLFPSLYEGWGLPVTESLANGAPCLAANCTSLPEAGGTFARYFNPDDLQDVMGSVRAILDDPAGLKTWRAEIAQNFRPTAWAESAAVILRILRESARTRTAEEPAVTRLIDA